ncbi:hypothetical protein XBP1_2210008 [Xenorhabdus bovienii str. puntauvense]|uniref:Uncharacterized protein n=2 Tax=Xenorhabdus bovienii TaxID=40576 RepID=A0A0B6XG03_XENBV|nr:hypothetical protein XBP1_2210008 [Xenorhabdus bovienii str. puntauvense]CDM91469.1 protein of unknown function [Xenorhabdus bovienii]
MSFLVEDLKKVKEIIINYLLTLFDIKISYHSCNLAMENSNNGNQFE